MAKVLYAEGFGSNRRFYPTGKKALVDIKGDVFRSMVFEMLQDNNLKSVDLNYSSGLIRYTLEDK
jgi:hypothetical protein